MKRTAVFTTLIVAAFISVSASAAEVCGATERWAVKTGTDPDADKVDRQTVHDIAVGGLNQLPQLRGDVPAGDNSFRLEQERVVYRVTGRLVLFKDEADSDYHLVITDDSLNYSPGGSGTTGEETGTSFIAEIPDPKCYAGKHGDPNIHSEFEQQLKDVRIKFEKRFPGGEDHDTDLGGIAVTLVGVAFYDRQHNQTGRAINGIELHPLLDIEFNDRITAPSGAIATLGQPAGLNGVPLFRDPNLWSTSNPDVRDPTRFEEDEEDAEDSITIGGNGRPRQDSIWQELKVPDSNAAIFLSFALRIETDNIGTATSKDNLSVQVRTPSGKLLKTLATFSNTDARKRPRSVMLDISQFRGRVVRLQFTSTEKATRATKFTIEDVTVKSR